MAKKVNAPTHEVIHSSFYWGAGENLKQLAVGTRLALNKKQAENLVAKGFVKAIGDGDTVDASGEPDKAAQAEIVDLTSKLEAANTKVSELATTADDHTEKVGELEAVIIRLNEELAPAAEKLTTAEGEIADLKTDLGVLDTRATESAEKLTASEGEVTKLNAEVKKLKAEITKLKK